MENDLRETFQKWGPLQSVQVVRDGPREVGVVTFEDQVDAADAQRQLHGYTWNFQGSPGVMVVVLGGPEQLAAATPLGISRAPPAFQVGGVRPGGPQQQAQAPPPPPQQQQLPQAPQQQQPPGWQPEQQHLGSVGAVPKGFAPASRPPSLNAAADGAGNGSTNGFAPMRVATPRPEWCSKIVVQAELLHAEFPTILKILGDQNANVEHVRRETQCNVELRGRGSNFKEPDGQELQEPLFLWLTANNVQSDKSAQEMVQDLLKSVYEEHQDWCSRHNQPLPTLSDPVPIENPDVLPGQGAPVVSTSIDGYGPCGVGRGVVGSGEWGGVAATYHAKGP